MTINFSKRHLTAPWALSLPCLHQEKDPGVPSPTLSVLGEMGSGGEPGRGAPGLWELSLQDISWGGCAVFGKFKWRN